MSINDRDIDLLNRNPEQLLLQLQDLIGIIVNKFIQSGKFHPWEKEEITQQVNEELLLKTAKIKSQFKGDALLRTYLATIIRNIYLEIIRSRKNNITVYQNKQIEFQEISNLDFLVLEEEMDRLRKAMEMYHKQKEKLMLCLTLKFRMPFVYEDFTRVFKQFTQADFKEFNESIKPYYECSDHLLYSALTRIFNQYENKYNTPDALRKWIKQKINELIDLLNGGAKYGYTEETFQFLFEKCFFKSNDSILHVKDEQRNSKSSE
ncbi:MAG: sigma-70 family RNA polymerase sigma factor [Bacteroidales bacterium]|nr:sigma-70 family RNA polymerase sigma factor [Bacteroidales bacterium]